MNDGVGMTPEDEGTTGRDTPSRVPDAGQKSGSGGAGAGSTTNVTSWSGSADRTPGSSGSSDDTAGTSRPDDSSGTSVTLDTTDPAMTDQPAEGGVEEVDQ